jgi:predicted ester cyclase
LNAAELADFYRDYIACLNRQDWPRLGEFVGPDVRHNGQLLRVSGYREMLEGDFDQIPDLFFNVDLLVCEQPVIAARLRFDCTPRGMFLGLPVNGKRVSFTENVFYVCRGGRIDQVWSVIDKVAIEGQLAAA